MVLLSPICCWWRGGNLEAAANFILGLAGYTLMCCCLSQVEKTCAKWGWFDQCSSSFNIILIIFVCYKSICYDTGLPITHAATTKNCI